MSEETSQTVDTSSDATASEATTVTTEGETQSTTSYLDGKYESVSALESGYKELQSSYSKKNAEYNDHMKGFAGAPEAYELNEGINGNDTLSAWGLENGLSNEGYNNLLTSMSEAETAQSTVYKNEQLEALGKDANSRINNATDWVRANLGEEAVEGINSMWVGAKGIEAIEKLMKMGNTASPTVAPTAPAVDGDKLSAMRYATDNYGNRRMSSDSAYRSKVEALERDFLATGGKLTPFN